MYGRGYRTYICNFENIPRDLRSLDYSLFASAGIRSRQLAVLSYHAPAAAGARLYLFLGRKRKEIWYVESLEKLSIPEDVRKIEKIL